MKQLSCLHPLGSPSELSALRFPQTPAVCMSLFLSSCCKSGKKKNQTPKHFKEAGAEGMQSSRGLKWLQDFDSRCLVKGGINGSLCVVSPRYLILRIRSLWRKLLLVFPAAKRLLGHLCMVISLKSCLSVFGLTSYCLICSSVKCYLLCTLKFEGNAVTQLSFLEFPVYWSLLCFSVQKFIL